MQGFDREAFSAHRLRSSDPLHNNGATRRDMRPDTAIIGHMREDIMGTDEDPFAKVRVDVRKLRAALARNHKQTINAAAALQPRAAASPQPLPAEDIVTRGRFHSLRTSAGRACRRGCA